MKTYFFFNCYILIPFIFFISCHRESDSKISIGETVNTIPLTVPERVAGIPAEAFWIGGSDGGQWYVVDSINKIEESAFFKIYNDYSGNLEVSKRFKLRCTGSAAKIKWENLKGEILAWDGDRIILQLINDKKGYCFFE